MTERSAIDAAESIRIDGRVPPSRWTFALCVLFAVLTGCADPRQRAQRTLQQVGAQTLRKDAAVLYKNLFASGSSEFLVVKPADWPRTFARFEPRRVGAYPDGFSLALDTDADSEIGLYVIPLSMDRAPRGAPGAKFEEMATGIYWYHFSQ